VLFEMDRVEMWIKGVEGFANRGVTDATCFIYSCLAALFDGRTAVAQNDAMFLSQITYVNYYQI
jgi:hypothetical protein